MSMAQASSAYFRIPKFTHGDLEEVMQTFRPQEYGDLAPDQDLPFYPFPGAPAADEDAFLPPPTH
ncbi:MAG TPA: hypothetical protein PKO15_06440 [Fibrobacteria bacterium]|nr:hypothetical protein [Fibrobacteria bacterium]HOX52149.1 hypothetical protein [Fibrobacteria bacterium]